MRTHIKNQEGQSMTKVVIEEFEWIWCLHGLPLWIISNPQGQEYGSSAVQGAVLNLPAVCIGRHHCGHTPWWPGAQHMVGCWEYTAMRPRRPCDWCTASQDLQSPNTKCWPFNDGFTKLPRDHFTHPPRNHLQILLFKFAKDFESFSWLNCMTWDYTPEL